LQQCREDRQILQMLARDYQKTVIRAYRAWLQKFRSDCATLRGADDLESDLNKCSREVVYENDLA